MSEMGAYFLAMVSHVGRILMDLVPQKQVRRSVGICKRGFMDGVMRSERGGEMEREREGEDFIAGKGAIICCMF